LNCQLTNIPQHLAFHVSDKRTIQFHLLRQFLMDKIFSLPLMMIHDGISYCFWWVLLTTFQLIWYVVVAIAPASLIENIIRKNFEGWDIKVTNGTAKSECHEKTRFTCELVIHDRHFYKRFARNSMLALGESFMVHNKAL